MADSRNASPVSAPRPMAISASAINRPSGSANGSTIRTRGASGETRANSVSWPKIEAGLAASKNEGSRNLSIPAYTNVAPKNRRTGRRARAGTLALSSRSRREGSGGSAARELPDHWTDSAVPGGRERARRTLRLRRLNAGTPSVTRARGPPLRGYRRVRRTRSSRYRSLAPAACGVHVGFHIFGDAGRCRRPGPPLPRVGSAAELVGSVSRPRCSPSATRSSPYSSDRDRCTGLRTCPTGARRRTGRGR